MPFNNFYDDTDENDAIGFGGNITGTFRKSWQAEKTTKNPPTAQEQESPTSNALAAFESSFFNMLGLDLSKNLLDHYAAGSGDTVTLSPDELKKGWVYQRAVKKNNERFERSMTNEASDVTAHPFYDQLVTLKEGERIKLRNPELQQEEEPTIQNRSDYWDRDISRIETFANGDIDDGFAIGAAKLRSLGDLYATRQKDKILIDGEIDHTLNDIYDFNNDTLSDRNLLGANRRMVEQNNAKPFKVTGTRKQKLQGVLRLKDGQVDQSDFEWQDMDD